MEKKNVSDADQMEHSTLSKRKRKASSTKVTLKKPSSIAKLCSRFEWGRTKAHENGDSQEWCEGELNQVHVLSAMGSRVTNQSSLITTKLTRKKKHSSSSAVHHFPLFWRLQMLDQRNVFFRLQEGWWLPTFRRMHLWNCWKMEKLWKGTMKVLQTLSAPLSRSTLYAATQMAATETISELASLVQRVQVPFSVIVDSTPPNRHWICFFELLLEN